jgi:hypothetical protein
LAGFGWSSNRSGLTVDGHKPNGMESSHAKFRQNWVVADYFRTMGIQLGQGRDFTDADSPAAPQAVIVDKTFAKKYGGTLNTVGYVLGTQKVSFPDS